MLLKTIESFIAKNSLLNKGERVLVCVSGGPDSVFLLHLISSLRKKYRLKLFIAHVNHGLRGKESDSDEIFVFNLSRKLKLPFFSCRADVKKIAKSRKMSTEEAARELRYNFFVNLSVRHNIDRAMLGHTKDDQVETIIMRILRGTGIKGLCGMKAENKIRGVNFIRPLLETEKTQIVSFLKKHKINSRTDSSNLKEGYFRNKVRLKIIPVLSKYSPQLKENIFRMGENAKQVDEFLESKVSDVYKKAVKTKTKSSLQLEKKIFWKLPAVLRSELLRKIIRELKGDLTGIDFKHIQILEDFIRGNISKGRRLDLPKAVLITRTRKYIDFQDKKTVLDKIDLKYPRFLNLKKCLRIPELNLELKASVIKNKISIKKLRQHSGMVEYFDFDKLRFPLEVRTRKSGDLFHPLGSRGKKKLKKFLIDKKVSFQAKDNIALIISAGEIAWVAGLRLAENFKVTEDSKRILKIQAKALRVNS